MQTQNPIISEDGTKTWHENGNFHRTRGPAIEFTNGDKIWMKNGLTHRNGGLPAVECANGDKEWWVEGVYQKKENGEGIDGNLQKKEKDDGIERIFENGKLISAVLLNGLQIFYKDDGKTTDRIIGPDGKLLYDADSVEIKKNENKDN